ncbi:MAG: hypothetical protein WCR49_05250 [Opitutae bacterium]
MPLPSSLTRRTWLLVPLLAVAFILVGTLTRIQRIDHVSNVGRTPASSRPAAATGNAAASRELIVPEHISSSYAWIVQTQQMLAGSEWRVRHLEYDNAPYGRAVHSASPYRWWLGLVAWVMHVGTGQPLGPAVERAALYADPLLHCLLLLGTTLFVARCFGCWPAALLAASLVALFPFAAGFLPGVPDDFSLLLLLTPWCVLPLLMGIKRLAQPGDGPGPAGDATRPAAGWFFVAGLAGGLGLWISVAGAFPLLTGVFLGGLLAAGVQRATAGGKSAVNVPPSLWRAWSVGGATTVLVAYLIEYFPAHLASWELRVIHPLYGLGWLGAGELLVQLTAGIRQGRSAWKISAGVTSLLALAALAAVPVVMWRTENLGFLSADILSFRLTKQADGIMAPNLVGWLTGNGFTATLGATLLPLLLVLVSCGLVLRPKSGPGPRIALALALGPVVVALGQAYFHLRWWQLLDGSLLPLLVAATAAIGSTDATRVGRWVWAGLVALAIGPGLGQMLPSFSAGDNNVLTVPEVEGLVERDLAQWLTQHTLVEGGPVVLAPPSLSTALHYYGGLRVLSSLAWENKDGLYAALRVVISTSREEALTLLRQRGVTHLVIPSWDDFFENYKRPASIQTNELFFVSLDRWALPPWLRPVAYQLPAIAGFEAQSVKILEVVEEQDAPVADSRLTEYFIEMGQVENAKIAEQMLRRYPADFGVLVARAQVKVAAADAAGFTSVFEPLLQRLAAGADRSLPWDRRVSLAIVLARGKRLDLARPQVQRCLAEMTEARLRTLPTNSLYHVLVLKKALGLEMPDPRLQALALALLPAEARPQL